MANRYWVGGSGNWSDNANHWSESTGGSPNASKPTSSDSVFFDVNSFSGAGQTVTINEATNCLDMDWTGSINTPTMTNTAGYTQSIYGSLTLISSMNMGGAYSGFFQLKSTTTGNSITTNGKTCYSMAFSGVDGSWSFADNVVLNGNFAVSNGTVDFNNKNLSCAVFNSSGTSTRRLDLGSSVITCADDITLTNKTNLTFNYNTSKFIMTGDSKTFNGGGLTFYDLECQGTPITIVGNNTFHDIKGTATKSIKFTAESTQTITTMSGAGTSGNLITIESTSAGTPYTINKASGSLFVSYYSIKDCAATGGATFTATNSTDVSGNSGWLFIVTMSASISIESTVVGVLKKATTLASSISVESTVIGTLSIGKMLTASISGNATVTGKLIKKLSSIANNAVSSFVFNDKLYILDGAEYRVYNGTAISVVAGYRPVIATATPPAGGGTDNEGINNLTGAKSQYFNGNASATVFQLRETAVTSIDAVRVGGVTKTLTTHYTVDLTAGTVTTTNGNTAGTGVDNVEIDWTKGTGTRSVVTGNKYANLFGGQNDSRVFLYGDGTNEIIYSGLANGVPSAEYFPVLNTSLVGSTDSPITYIDTQYDRQIIYGKNNAHYCTIEQDATLGTIFPIYPLNDSIGNKPYGQGKLIQNNPMTFDTGVYEWISTTVRDERNANYISERIQSELEAIDLSTIITHDYKKQGELWIVSAKTVYVYNYRRNVWYKFTLADTPKCFWEIDGDLFFGTSAGNIMMFSDEALTDNGTKIADLLETGDIDFGQNWKRKFLNFAYIGLQPEGRSKANIGWVTDYATSSDVETIEYNNLDFGNIDFSSFSFTADYSPKPFRIKSKAKKFTYLKLVISCDSTTHDMTILNISLPAIVGGVSK